MMIELKSIWTEICSCEEQSSSWQVKAKKNEFLQALILSDNKTSALHASNLYKQYKANVYESSLTTLCWYNVPV